MTVVTAAGRVTSEAVADPAVDQIQPLVGVDHDHRYTGRSKGGGRVGRRRRRRRTQPVGDRSPDAIRRRLDVVPIQCQYGQSRGGQRAANQHGLADAARPPDKHDRRAVAGPQPVPELGRLPFAPDELGIGSLGDAFPDLPCPRVHECNVSLDAGRGRRVPRALPRTETAWPWSDRSNAEMGHPTDAAARSEFLLSWHDKHHSF